MFDMIAFLADWKMSDKASIFFLLLIVAFV